MALTRRLRRGSLPGRDRSGGGRSGSHVGAAARLHHGVEPLARRVRDRDEHGVGLEPAERPADLVERRRRRARPGSAAAAARGRRRRTPTTRSPGVSRSSRSRLRPLRPAPTISVRRWFRRPTNEPMPRATARSENRAAPIERRAEQEVDEEDAAREAVPRDGRPHEEERGGLRDEHGARRRWPRRARPHSATRRGRGRTR